jgi:hypothetical protein
MLEIVDGAFDEIATEVDEYKVAIATKTPTQLSDTELNSLSLQRYLRELTEQHDLDIEFVEIPDGIMTELKLYGIHKIGDLKLIADAKTLNKIRDFSDEAEHSENLIGFVRTLMMYHDIDRYFTVWRRWTGLDVPTANLLKEKYGQQKLGEILSKFHIAMEGEEHEDSDDDDIPQ